MSKAFVTGGSSPIGRRLIKHLSQRGDEVTTVLRPNGPKTDQCAKELAQLQNVHVHIDGEAYKSR